MSKKYNSSVGCTSKKLGDAQIISARDISLNRISNQFQIKICNPTDENSTILFAKQEEMPYGSKSAEDQFNVINIEIGFKSASFGSNAVSKGSTANARN